MKNKNYKYYQPNDKDTKDKYGDCVIRALTKVLCKDWLTVFDELLPYAKELQCMPNERRCYEEYLFDNGFAYQGVSNRKGSKRPTVESFSKDHKQGSYFELSMVRGWIMDELEKRDPTAYDKWLDMDYPTNEALRELYLGDQALQTAETK